MSLINAVIPVKKTWSLINNIIRPNSSQRNISEIKTNDGIITESKSIAEAFNNYFVSIGKDISDSIPSSGDHLKFMRGNINSSFFIQPTDAQEVFSMISNLEPKSCNSVNDIPVRVLKRVNYVICHPLSTIINQSYSVGIFPEMLKVAKVIPIPKQGDLSLTQNYRPISLLNTFSKIFEKLMYKRLYAYLEKNEILYKKQYGFRSKKSTSDALISNTIEFYKALDKGNIIFSMFLDFRKAFDCVDPQILISKLRYYGVRGIATKWFESFICGRKQFTFLNDQVSSIKPIFCGVPQGSTLGPLLFLIFINDLPNSSNLFDFTLFADDCTLTSSFKAIPSTYSSVATNINSELITLNEWFNQNKISVNYSKTKYIIFTYGKKVNFPSIHINQQIIHQTESIRFLGVFFDEKLNFREHLNYISGKISKWIGILYKIRDHLPTEVLLKLYKSFIDPYLRYGLEVWFGGFQYLEDSILILQKKALRCIYKLPYNEHTSYYFKISRTLKISDLFNLSISIIMFKMLHCGMYNELRSDILKHSDIHSHCTRNRNNFVLPFYTKTRSQKSMLYLGVKILNKNFNLLVESSSLYICKKSLCNMFFYGY